MIRQISVAWPDDRPFRERAGRPIRLIAVPTNGNRRSRSSGIEPRIGPIDAVIGAGDVDPRWLAFLADAFSAPLVYVRGNHDRGGDWDERRPVVPDPLAPGATTRVAGIAVAGFEWPRVNEPGTAAEPTSPGGMPCASQFARSETGWPARGSHSS